MNSKSTLNNDKTPIGSKNIEPVNNKKNMEPEITRNLMIRFQKIDYNDVILIFVNLNRCTLQDATEFRDYLLSFIYDGCQKLIIDLTMAELIDSSFIGALVAALKKISEISGELRLVLDEDKMKSSTFYISGMDRVFNISETVHQSLNSFA